MKTTTGRAKAPSKTYYEIGGRVLSVEADVKWARRFADTFLGGFYLAPLGSMAGPAADLRLTVFTAATPPLPAGLQVFQMPGGVCHLDEDRYFLEVCSSRVAVNTARTQQVSIWLGAGVERRRSVLITLMAYALPAALRGVGLYDLHATGMVEPESGAGFLFPGMSGSGKTSLAIRLATAGWLYMSDDLVVVAGCEEGVEALPLRRAFQADAASVAGCYLPRLEVALGVRVPNDPSKCKLDPGILFPDRFAARSLPRVICFPVITCESHSRVEPAGQAEAMSRIVRMCPWASYDASTAREHLGLLGRLVRQCRSYVLHAGRDIFDDPSGADRLLAPLARSFTS